MQRNPRMTFSTRTLSRLIPTTLVLALVGTVSSSCGHPSLRMSSRNPAEVDVTQLWIEPADLESRDLYNGPGGAQLAPNAGVGYALIKLDSKGYSPGYQVRDAEGTTWDVKLGPEAQTEVVASRALWAIGYHQPPVYYPPNWTLDNKPQTPPQGERFRPELAGYKVVSDWSLYENDFVNTMPFKGLVVANLT